MNMSAKYKIIATLVVWVVAVNLFGIYALNRLNLKPDTAYNWINPDKVPQEKSWNLIPIHAKWDSFWYLDIAQNGYKYQTGALSNIVFFPIYPLLIRTFMPILDNPILWGWLISLAGLFGALIYLYKLVKEFEPQVDPLEVIGFLLIFPTALFFNAVYTESIFLFLSVACFYHVFKKNFYLAALFGVGVALTRVTGVLLFFPIAYEYYKWKGFKISKQSLSILLIPATALSFFIFHWIKFGDFFLFFKVESLWGRNFAPNTSHVSQLAQSGIANLSTDIFYLAIAIAALVIAFKKLRLSYAIYMSLTLAVALASGTIMSIGRYILVLFPMYIVFASIKNTLAKQYLAFVFILLLAMNILLFVNSYWAG